MRDHLMGYTANVERSADCEMLGEDFDDFDWLTDERFPFGIPTRVRKEWAQRFSDPAQAQRAKELEDFQCLNHPLPDGMVLPARKAKKTPSIHELIQAQILKRSDELAANIKKNNRLKDAMEAWNKGERISANPGIGAAIGGACLGQQGSSLRGADDKRFSGYELLNVPADEVIKAAEFQMKQLSVPLIISTVEPVELTPAGIQSMVQDELAKHPTALQAYMAGYQQHREEITKEVQQSAAEKAKHWDDLRRAQLKRNDARRFEEAMAETKRQKMLQAMAETIPRDPPRDCGLQGSRNSPWHAQTLDGHEVPVCAATPC